MKKQVLAVLFAAAMALSLTACAGENASSESGSSQSIGSESADAELTKLYLSVHAEEFDAENVDHQLRRLWWLANTVYNVDDIYLAEYADAPEEAPWVSAMRFYDYEGTVNAIFTENGIAQLEAATVGSDTVPYIWKAEDGEVYHLGPWKTGVGYEDLLDNFVLLSEDTTEDGKRTCTYEMRYRMYHSMESDTYDLYAVKMTIQQQPDGRWLVENLQFPENRQVDLPVLVTSENA